LGGTSGTVAGTVSGTARSGGGRDEIVTTVTELGTEARTALIRGDAEMYRMIAFSQNEAVAVVRLNPPTS